MKIICKNRNACQFAWEVFDFLSKHYVINLIPGRVASLFCIQDSPFGGRSPFSNAYRPNRDLPDPINISGNEYYLTDDWYIDKKDQKLSIFDNLKEYVRQITNGKYDIKEESGEFILFEHVMTVPMTADNLIRVDYTYMDPIQLSRVLSPKVASAGYFDLTSTILASTGNVSFLALMDRIPVYVVDSKFMQNNFDNGSTLWEKNAILFELLLLLEEILDILQGKTDAEKLSTAINNALGLVGKLLKFKECGRIILKVKDFLDSIKKWVDDKGATSAIENNNFEPWLKRIIDELRGEVSMPTEALGVYCHEWKKNNGFNEKAIFICWERIHDCAGRGHAVDLLTKVTIHEFCHAYMDVIAGSGHASKDVYHWMEESMANVLTLKVIENYVIKHPSAQQVFEYAKSFMVEQPEAYASAVRMWENGICDYDLWAWNKEKCLVAPSVRTWCKEMEAQGDSVSTERMRTLWNEVKKEIIKNFKYETLL